MADSLGLSFSPFDSNSNKTGQPPQTGSGPIQDAIRVLSLKIPRVSGGAPIPQQLLNAPGAPMGAAGSMQSPQFAGDLMELIRRLFGGDATAAQGAPPKFIPGIGNGGGGIGQGEPPPATGTPGPINPGNQVQTPPGGINWADVLNRGGVTGQMSVDPSQLQIQPGQGFTG